jgi:hypothetical protein
MQLRSLCTMPQVLQALEQLLLLWPYLQHCSQ